METEHLKTFLEVNNTRHFGRAAENLHLTQAAVSARIKQLENTIGSPLFVRFRNNLKLTLTGERLVGHAETILIAWERARQDVALKKNHKHAVALGTTSGLWDLVLKDTLMELTEKNPELALRAESHGPDTLTRHLMERTLDFALMYEPAKVADIESVAITPSELVLVGDRDGEPAEDAIKRKYVSVDWGLSFQVTFAQQFPDLGSPLLHTTLSTIALDYILKMGGCAYLPYRLVEPYLGDKLFVSADAPIITRQIFACYLKDSLRQKEIQTVMNTIQSQEVPADVENTQPDIIEI